MRSIKFFSGKFVFSFRQRILILIILFVIALTQGIVVWRKSRPKTLSEYAGTVLAACREAPYRPTCYDKEIPQLMDQGLSMEQSFGVTKLVQQGDASYAYCHVLGHALSARETKKRPDSWKDIITRCPSGSCSNGCIHGAFQERFRTDVLTDTEIEKLLPEFKTVCEPRGNWKPTLMEQASCYHALGHLLMYITGADVTKATKVCEDIGIHVQGTDYSQVCFDGAFMQIYQPLEPEDIELVKGKQPSRETHATFCNEFTGERKSSCWSEGWPLHQDELLKPAGLSQYCEMLEANQRERCFNAIMYALVVQFRFELPTLHDFCMGLLDEKRGRCFANVASRLLETDSGNIEKAIEWCRDASLDAQSVCYDELVTFAPFLFHRGSQEFYNLCQRLPEPWSGRCLERKNR